MMQPNAPNLTRRGILDLARNELGLPLSKSWLDQLTMVGRGPKPIGRVGPRHVYAREEVLRWIANDLIKPVILGGRRRRRITSDLVKPVILEGRRKRRT
jgi:hypothetical protein